MNLPRRSSLALAAFLSFVAACGVLGPKTTAAYDAQPPGTIGVALPLDLSSTPRVPDTVRRMLEQSLADHGWPDVSASRADAVLHPKIETWEWNPGNWSASVRIRARLERRSDGELLWEHWGFGYNAEDECDDDEQSDNLFDWVVDQAFEAARTPIRPSARKQRLRAAARECLANMFDEFPDGPGIDPGR